MAQTFLERNKRKSILALLLLLLRWKRGTAPLLIMLMLLMLVFIAPSNLAGYVIAGLRHLPMGAPLANAIGKLITPKDPNFNNLMAALKAAREDKRAGWGVFSRAGAATPFNTDSLRMVRGSQDDLLGASVADRLAKRQTVSGVLTQEDADNSVQGVSLTAQDVAATQNGLVAEAGAAGRSWLGNLSDAAGKFFGARAGQAGMAPGAGTMPYAGPNTIAGNGPNAGANTTTPLTGTSVPTVTTTIVRGQGGRMSVRAIGTSRTSNGLAANRNSVRGGGKALRQLSDGRARAQVARDPSCTPASGCPGEYASTNTGAVYDGNRIGIGGPGVILAGPGVHGVEEIGGTPVVPNDGDLQREIDRATKIQEDARKCQQADARYKDEEGLRAQNIKAISDRMNAECTGGGCSRSKARRCRAMGNEMKAECRALDAVMLSHYNDCPLMQEDVQPDGSVIHRDYVHQPCD